MKRKRRKKTREEWAEIEARHNDIMRRLREMIERYRARAVESRRLRGEPEPQEGPVTLPSRKRWTEMSREERAAERARSKDLDRRLLAMIERYRRREAEAS